MDNKAFQPYVGPRPFTLQDQAIFFGREREASTLPSLIIAHREVLIYAQSGAGKTSLINTTVMPRLKAEGMEVFPVARVRAEIPRAVAPETIDNIYVFNALAGWSSQDPTTLASLTLAEFLRQETLLTDAYDHPLPRVLFFDQFEELFTFYPERMPDRRRFFEQVGEALHEDPQLHVVFAMREDYIAHLDSFAALLPEQLRTRYRLERLSKPSAIKAVIGPLSLPGSSRSYAPGVAEQLVEDLACIKIRSLEGELKTISGEYVEPVQLQVVCQNLWDSLGPQEQVITEEHLREAGDVRRVLTEFYEHRIAEVAKATRIRPRRLRRWFEQHLITEDGRRSTVDRGTTATGGLPNQAVDMLEDHHLIRAEWRAGGRWYEIVHDSFVEPILESNAPVWRRERLSRVARAIVALLVLTLAASAAVLAFGRHQDWLTTQRLAGNWVSMAVQALSDHNRPLALALAREAHAANPQPDMRLARVLAEAYAPGPRLPLAGHTAPVTDVALSPDGERALSASQDGWLILWDIENHQEIRRFRSPSSVIAVAFAGSDEVAVSVTDAQMTLWDVVHGEPLMALPDPSLEGSPATALEGSPATALEGAPITALEVSPDGRQALIGAEDGSLSLWDLKTGDELRRLEGYHARAISDIAFAAGGTQAVSASWEGSLVRWDLHTGEVLTEFALPPAHSDAVTRIALTADDRMITGGLDGALCIWDITWPEPIEECHTLDETGAYAVASLVVSPDGNTILAGLDSGELFVYTAGGLRQGTMSLEDHTFDRSAPIRDVEVLPGGNSAIVASGAGSLTIWDLGDERIRRFAPEHNDSVHGVAFSPDGRRALSGAGAVLTGEAQDTSMVLWDVATGEMIRRFDGHTDSVTNVVFSPDGRQALSASRDTTVIRWDLESGEVLSRLEGHADWAWDVAFSPDGQQALSVSRDATVLWWDLESGELLSRLEGHADWVNSVAFSPDGQQAVTGADDYRAIVWDLTTRQPAFQFDQHAAGVEDVGFSPDGNRIVAGSYDGSVYLWALDPDQDDSAPYRRLTRADRYPVRTVAFSPDGRMVAAGYTDGTIVLWDVERAEEADRVTIPLAGNIWSVAFSPDGSTVLFGDDQGNVSYWRLVVEPAHMAAAVAWARENRVPHQFSCDERTRYDLVACTPVPRQRLAAGQTVRGAVAPSLAEIWLFEGRAGQRVTISLREDNSGLDPILILVGPDGTELQYDDDGWGYPNAIIQDYRLPLDGTYTITALGFGSSSGAYALTLTDLELTTPTAAPTSTSPPQVVQQPITPGETVSGEILPGGRDLWSFEGAAGQRITITMREDDSGLDAVLILVGPDGAELRYDDDGWYGFNAIIQDYRLPLDGTYTITALGFGDSAGAYLLTLTDLELTTPTAAPTSTSPPQVVQQPITPGTGVGVVAWRSASVSR